MRLRKIMAGAMAIMLLETGAQAACDVSATGVDFGVYDQQSNSPTDGAGSVTVQCSSTEQSVFVEMSTGQSGNYSERQMSSGGETMRYNLYTTASRTSIWGDNSVGNSRVTLSKVRRPETIPVYGRIPAGQNLSAGAYNDSIFVTIIY